MSAFYRASVSEFLVTSESELTGRLSIQYASSGFASLTGDQVKAWVADILRLQQQLALLLAQAASCASWTVLLEFPIPRKGKRIDVVLLAADTIILLELKSSSAGREAAEQLEEYGLLLHYFHEPSSERKIVPFVVAPHRGSQRVNTQQFLPIRKAPAFWIAPVEQVAWTDLALRLQELASNGVGVPLDPVLWDEGEYRPVPSIIDAARSLQNGLQIREIAHARAARHDVEELSQSIALVIDDAREHQRFAICFRDGCSWVREDAGWAEPCVQHVGWSRSDSFHVG